MDNPQETEKLNNIKWLAGFFDAEGSISFNYKPNIDIVNTCAKTIFHIKFVMDSIGIDVGINEREKPSKSSKKKRWDIFLRHEDQIKPFLSYVKPFVYGKQQQLETILEWYNKKDKTLDYADKIHFLNQLNHIIVLNDKKEKIKQKLKTDSLLKYSDIQLLNDEDGIINTYLSFNDCNYIAGLLDGDGCFNLNRRNTKTSLRYTPQVMLINTNKEIIKRYCSFLKNNDIGYHVSFRTAGKTTNRRRWDIVVSGVKRCQKFCSLLQESLISKKEQCNLLLQYSQFRLLNEKNNNNEIGLECKKALEGMRRGQY